VNNDGGVQLAAFRALVADFQRGQTQHREAERRAAAERRRRQLKELIEHHVSDQAWRLMLHNARQAAERGQSELMLLRFPSQLCSDRGRAINTMEPNWPANLRGEAAELYLRWERDLKPSGFHLRPRFPRRHTRRHRPVPRLERMISPAIGRGESPLCAAVPLSKVQRQFGHERRLRSAREWFGQHRSPLVEPSAPIPA
jgi:hypothetical protein